MAALSMTDKNSDSNKAKNCLKLVDMGILSKENPQLLP